MGCAEVAFRSAARFVCSVARRWRGSSSPSGTLWARCARPGPPGCDASALPADRWAGRARSALSRDLGPSPGAAGRSLCGRCVSGVHGRGGPGRRSPGEAGTYPAHQRSRRRLSRAEGPTPSEASGLTAARPAQLPLPVRPADPLDGEGVPDVVYELLATEVARDKLAARSISTAEVEQVPRNAHVMVRNPREGGRVGKTPAPHRRNGWPSGAHPSDRADRRADDMARRDRLERDECRA